MRLRRLLGWLVSRLAARFATSRSAAYPAARLLPRPTYRLLLPPHQVVAGWLLRRTEGTNVFAPAAGGRQLVHDPKQLCDPPRQLTEGLSVSLWGHFQLPDNGWKVTKAGQADSFKPWVPPQAAKPPAAEKMQYLPVETWEVAGLDVAAINGYSFSVVAYGQFTARVCHAPNCWNFWHYEVRFQNAQGQWLHRLEEYTPRPYSNKHLKLLQEGLLASFIQAGLAQSVATVPAPAPLPRTDYDTRPPWWARLLGR